MFPPVYSVFRHIPDVLNNAILRLSRSQVNPPPSTQSPLRRMTE